MRKRKKNTAIRYKEQYLHSRSIKILLSSNTRIFVHRNYKCPHDKATLKLKIIIAEFKILVCIE